MKTTPIKQGLSKLFTKNEQPEELANVLIEKNLMGGEKIEADSLSFVDENTIFLTDGFSDLDSFNMDKFRFNKIFVISEGGSDEQLKGKQAKVIKLEKQYK